MAMRVFSDESGEGEAVYVLKRVPDPKKAGCYSVEERFRFRHPTRTEWDFTVPKQGATFVTDLASVPGVATWLVPKDGTHTPAALLHDALVREPDEDVAHDGPDVTREDADQIFRDAMHHLGVPLVRRWMMWAAVSLATLWSPMTRRHWLWRLRIGLIVGALVATGLVSVLDLVDIHRVRVPLLGWTISTELPWMGDRSVGAELAGGLLVALAATLVTPALFGRRWRVGLVAGLVVIPLAFPLVVAAAGYAGYLVVETALFLVLRSRARSRSVTAEAPPAVPPKPLQRMA